MKEPIEYKIRKCLKCGLPHKSTWSGDRFHDKCRIDIREIDHRAYENLFVGRIKERKPEFVSA